MRFKATVCFAAAMAISGQVQGVTDTEIVLGSVLDLTGPAASIGLPMKAAFEIGAASINEAGGINGRKIRLIIEDSGYDPRSDR